MSNRQLAAIMFTDIVGYTALMGDDDQKAFGILKENRELQKPIIEQFNGRWIKELGDGVMASFDTVADAVYAAIKIQESNATKEFQLRIGIHLGDVLFENDDVFGDGVNIAARIQSAASPGSIFISEAVNHSISNKKDIKTQFVKEEILKNVSQPVRMYQVMFIGSSPIVQTPPTRMASGRTSSNLRNHKPLIAIASSILLLAIVAFFLYTKLGAPTKPPEPEKSIAVLPFVNMSDDAEQEYFSDGLSEELLNLLAKTPKLKVIGRTSSFAFKGKNEDMREIGKKLGVAYLLEGSVRRSGDILRITAQLINVADGYHIYSEKFDRKLEDIFAIQDEISQAILDAIKIELFASEKEAVFKRYTDNVEAYQLYLQGRFYYNKFSPDDFIKAIEYFEAAIAVDSTYAIAYAGKSFCYMNLWSWNWLPPEKSLPQALKAAQQALQLDGEIAESHLAVGRVKLHYELNIGEALVEYKKAIAINPNSAECHVQLSFCAVLMGNNEEAMKQVKIAENLDPFSPLNLAYLEVTAFSARDSDKVLALAKRLIDLEPNFFFGYEAMGDYFFLLKNYKEAIHEYELALALNYSTYNLSALGITYGLMGEKLKAREIIEKMKKTPEAEFEGDNTNFGNVYAGMGELDTAFQYYDKAIESHESFMLWIKTAVIVYIPELKKDPRTNKLLEKIGVPPL
ncbi:MAG: hypothetical protein OEV24_19320 [Cyclobacteriaceae bacterium]|nr:hypothetical protein [Cyclobacteriaceae bacterium]